ncbi:MAG TPA: zinc ribbon domain-containing protein [Acidimicrobiales bacterium]
MTQPTERVVPFADRDSAPWWEALSRHELVLQRCDSCGRWRWPARIMCGECGSFDWSWQQPPDTGEIASWITTHHAFLPGFEAPYHTVFVRLDVQDDIVMPGSWFADMAPAIGMAVRVHFDDIERPGEQRVTLLGWEPRRGQEG